MGWYMERDGISTAVNADDIKKLTGQSQMTSNATFVARYVKNPAGHLTINHTMADGSTGTGTTYIGVEKSTDGTNWTWITGDGTDYFERADMFSVTDTDIMSYNSGYTLRVTLKTVVATDTEFNRFSANDDEHSPNYFSSDVETSGNTSTTSFEVPVDDLFAVVNGFPKQQFDTLTYFSHTVKRPELTINHNIDPTSDSTAEGDTYVKVEVTTAGGAVVKTYGGTEEDGYAKGKDLVVPSEYFYSGSEYSIKVYLKTVMEGFTQFDHFSIFNIIISNASGPNGETVTYSSSSDQRTKYATITFNAGACFDRGEFVLPYLSKLIVPDYKYVLKYTYAFAGCSNLSGEVTIPNTVTTFETAAFQNCTSLETVNIQSQNGEVPNQCFQGCSSLSSVTLNDSITRIGYYAFDGCSSLNYIEIPATVTDIANSAFQNIDDITLGVEYGSYAYDYAIRRNIPYVLTGLMLGDVNDDKQIDVLDALEVQKYAAETIVFSEVEFARADVNRDGYADVLDALLIQKHAAGLIVIE